MSPSNGHVSQVSTGGIRRSPETRAWNSSGDSGTVGPMLTSALWSGRTSFYALRHGEGCPLCDQGRPDETP